MAGSMKKPPDFPSRIPSGQGATPVTETSSQDVELLRVPETEKFQKRLDMILDSAVCPLLQLILTWVTLDWDKITPFKEFLKVKYGEEQYKKFMRGLYKKQKETLEHDSTGKEWDVSLYYKLLKISGGLDEKDDAWSSKSGREPERFITALKDIRNESAHEKQELDQTKFFNKVEEIRTLIKDAIVSVGIRYPHISQSEIDSNIDKFNQKINELRGISFLPGDINAYENEIFFSQLTEKMKMEGMKNLKKYLGRMTIVNPLSFIVEKTEMDVQVTNIFTGIQLEEENGKMNVNLENLFEVTATTNPGEFILLKGSAGIGKTTIVKKITSDWYDGASDIKNLKSFDLLLYAEFRDRIGSLEDLLRYSLGDVSQSFNGEDIVTVALNKKCLVILDGFDEMNTVSCRLFQDILARNKFKNNLTVVITTRPEAEKKLVNQLKYAGVKAVHIWLTGIEATQRTEFVTKYFNRLTQNSPPQKCLDGLLHYLQKTGHRMSEVWKLPYNLSLLSILWIFEHKVVNTITTEAELYWQMGRCIVSKLKWRLQRSEGLSHLHSSVLSLKTEIFLENFSWLSLIGLRNNEIYISEPVYKEIADLCSHLGVPVEEFAGAFLKKVITSKDTRYSFPHKGNQEFMGAYSIYKQVTGQCFDLMEKLNVTTELAQICSLPYMLQSVLEFLRKRLNIRPTIKSILRKLHDSSRLQSLEKYQNVLIQFLSISQVADERVPDETRMEALYLLEKSGLRDRDSWLKVLHNLKCDYFTAKWIVERQELFTEETNISDFTIEAYTALLKAIDPPLNNKENIKIKIDIKQTPFGLEELATKINMHNVMVEQILLREDFVGQNSSRFEDTICLLLHQDCVAYEGIWSPKFHLPAAMEYLSVRLPDQTAMKALWTSLKEEAYSLVTKIRVLRIRLSINLRYGIHPIPGRIPIIIVYITDIKTKEEAAAAGDILRGLQKQKGDKRSFNYLHFPRCSLRSEEEILGLLDSLSGVRVIGGIKLPKEIKPSEDSTSLGKMNIRAKLLCGCGIDWKSFE